MLSRPSILFSSDEVVACRLVTNELQFFDPAEFSKGFVSRFRIPGVAAAQLSKRPGSYVAAFVPESKVGFSCVVLSSPCDITNYNIVWCLNKDNIVLGLQ